ncbi:MAG: DUF72 domain-containing protein [candidate division WOR-3 bacterium]
MRSLLRRIIIGTCGYTRYKPEENWKEKYGSKLRAYSYIFPSLELNETFYKLPKVETAIKWREEVPKDFEFTMKSWQAITHPLSSPTWRSFKGNLTDKERESFGYLRPNQEIFKAWEKIKEVGEALKIKVCVIQTPISFGYSEENEKNIMEFFDGITRGNFEIAWEPRGSWEKFPEKIKYICDSLNIIHIVDIMREEPLSNHPIGYIRLHGLNKNKYNYNYNYKKEEIEILAEKLETLLNKKERIYCMFNNYQMYENAKALIELLKLK